MNILVTGGAGFIASHIVDALIDIGHRVAVVDNLSSGHRQNVNADCEFYEMDITDEQCVQVFATFKPEVVIHHAAQIDVRKSVEQPVFDATVNIIGSIRLLELCKLYEVRKIIYASSAAVYGTPTSLEITEEHPIQPLSGYGITKHTVEHYLDVYANIHGLDYTVLRYANVYGMRQDSKGEGGVVSIFVDRLLQGESPTIYGTGEQTRDFIFVRDIVNANLAALNRGSRRIVNIGTAQRTSVNQLLILLAQMMEISVAPIYKESRPGDIEHSCLNNRAAGELLLWQPRYSLEQGLKETSAYYKC